MQVVIFDWLVKTGIAPSAGALAVVWIVWLIYALRVESGRIDWDGKAKRQLFALAVFLHRISGDPELVGQLSLVCGDAMYLLANPELIDKALDRIPEGATPLALLKDMLEEEGTPRNPTLLIKWWLPVCAGRGFRNRVVAPVWAKIERTGIFDTAPEGLGRWRDFGAFLILIGVTGLLIGYSVVPNLVMLFGLVFGPLVSAGFMLHTVGFFRAGDILGAASRQLAVIASIAWTATVAASIGGGVHIGAIAVLASGLFGVAEYLVADSRLRQIAGTTGSTLVITGAGMLLAGHGLREAGILVTGGALLNNVVSVRRHLRRLTNVFR